MTTYQLIDVKSVSNAGNAVVVSIKEEFLSTSILAEMLYDELQHALASERPALMVLDFSRVKVTSSSTIGKLLMIQKQMQERGGRLHLCCLSIPIAEVYRTLGLSERHLMVFDSVEQALTARVIDTDDEREMMED